MNRRTMRLISRKILFLSLLAVILTACARPQLSPFAELGSLRTALEEEVLSFKDQLQRQDTALKALRAFGELMVREGMSHSRLKQAIVFRRPDRLRLEVFGSSLNQLLASVVVLGDRLQAIDMRERKAYEGRASSANIARFTSLLLSPEEAMLLFCGVVKPKEEELRLVTYSTSDDGHFMADYTLLDGRKLRALYHQELGSKGGRNFVLQALDLSSYAAEKPVFYAEFQYAVPVGEEKQETLRLPEKVKAFVEQTKQSLELQFIEQKLNPPSEKLPDTLFQLRFADDMIPEPLD